MPERTAIAYQYDGSFEGLMCCVFDSFARREEPEMLLCGRSEQLTLFDVREVQTDMAHARRVLTAIPGRICLDALEFAENAFLCCAPEVDLNILRFLRLGFRAGAAAMQMLTEPSVAALNKALLHLGGEVQLLKGFIRFSDAGGALTATIEPKNRVLPMIREHFCDRYNAELFMIYDLTHREALVHQDGKSGIFPLENLELPELSERERYIRALWQRFYKTIGIAERENPACRMAHMPKRYWPHMLEMEHEDKRIKPSVPDAPRPKMWYNQESLPQG